MFAGTWTGMGLDLLPWQYNTGGVSESFWIQWIGLFDSVEAAQAYAGADDPYDEPGSAQEGPVFEFNSQEAIDSSVIWSDRDDTNIVFDETEGTMRVDAADAKAGTNANGLFAENVATFALDLTKQEYSTGEYPILALRVKLNNPSSRGGWMSFSTTASDEALASGASTQQYLDMKRIEFKETKDWQTIVLDCKNDNAMEMFFDGSWTGVRINLALANFAGDEDRFWVEWAGIFTSVDAAYAYAGGEAPADPNPPTGEAPLKAAAAAAMLLSAGTALTVFLKKRRRNRFE
jgi:hypothetical protein